LFRKNCLVLPAYSADIAGTNVLKYRRWSGFRCWVVAGDAVLNYGKVAKVREVWTAWQAIHGRYEKRRARG
jgi:hypothetical protein